MKIALAQLNYHIGNLPYNVAKIKNGILRAKSEGAELVAFSELSVCGYPPKDLLLHDGFIRACEDAVKDIAQECKGIAAIVGAPARNEKHKGKSLFNSAFLLVDGQIAAQVNKTLLPFYDVFDEYRYFEPAEENELMEYKSVKIALTVCEDVWNERPLNDRYLYKHSSLETLCTPDTNCIINIAASPFSYIHSEERKQIFETSASRYKLPFFYVNALGANTDLIFDGGSMVIASNEGIVDEMSYFTEEISIYELSGKSVKPVKPQKRSHPQNHIERIYHALVLGIRDYFQKNNLTSAVLGLSGGIDSALVLALTAEALGSKNVHAVMLPSRYTSEESLKDAGELVMNIGCSYDSISIEPGINAAYSSLADAFKGRQADVTEENIQSRMRALLLMAISNKMGYLLLNTSNKSELATGYGTLYGDMSGALSVLGDVYKTQVYELARYINTIKKGLIPSNIITRPPSAELKPNQKDTDSLPDYDILDKVLHEYIEMEKSQIDIKVDGASPELVKRIVDMVNRNEYKRKQSPPILRVSPKAFGSGRRMPIVAKYI
jgi:NAD+ synthase (glutamine-hydrolysing)